MSKAEFISKMCTEFGGFLVLVATTCLILSYTLNGMNPTRREVRVARRAYWIEIAIGTVALVAGILIDLNTRYYIFPPWE